MPTTTRTGADLQVGDMILFHGAHRIERFDPCGANHPGCRIAVCEQGWTIAVDGTERFTPIGEIL